MASRGILRRWFIAGVAIALLGAVLITATIIWQWRHVPYGLGVAALVIGVVILIVVVIRRPVWKAITSVIVASGLVAGGVLAVTGIPNPLPRWDSGSSEDLSGLSARTGELLISEGAALDIATGDVVWHLAGDDVDPMLVSPDIVVLGTPDETVGLETSSGHELWRSPIAGRGISWSGDILVVAHSISETETEAVGLDLTNGQVAWRQPGRPVMECDLGATDRFSVAPERSHVIVVDEADTGGAQLLSVADGSVSVAQVECSLTARVIGNVLLEAQGDTIVGRSLADGEQLWATEVSDPWTIEGGGSVVFTSSQSSYAARADFEAIEVSTGRARPVEPPAGRAQPLSNIEPYRVADVWVLVDLDHGAAVWNPGTNAIVEIPNADSIDGYSVDVYSGWMAITGSVRDITGDTTPQCWALAPSGQLFGPAPGPGCYVDEGVLSTGAGTYPLQ